MTKSRSLMNRKNDSTDRTNNVCPHKHFKNDVIDRSILSRKQHLNLLCTPKGYRWMIKEVEPSGKSFDVAKNPCKLAKKNPGNTYIHNILAEMWDIITPEMAQRLKEMLMDEFGMSEEAALDFICHSRYDSTLTTHRVKNKNIDFGLDDRPPEGSTIPTMIAAQKLCKGDLNIGIDPCHIKEFSKALSSKFSEYAVAMTCAKRNSKHRLMADVVLKGLCDLTGEETTLDSPKNRLHKILTSMSDRAALWLVENMKNEGEGRANRRKREDKALKKKMLARKQDVKNRQKEKDRNNKDREMRERRRAQEELERSKSVDKEKGREQIEREKRHQEMERFREKENQKKKEEFKKMRKKAKEESSTAKGKGSQAGGDQSKQLRTKPGQNKKPVNVQSKRDNSKSGSNVYVVPQTGGPTSNQAKNISLRSNQTQQGANSRIATENSSGALPAAGKAEKTASQGEDINNKYKPNQRQESTNNEIPDVSQISVSKSVNWGDKTIKNVASAFSASGKLTPTTSTSSSVDKLVNLLRGEASKRSLQEKIAVASSSQDRPPASISSQAINAKVFGSQGKLATEHSSHLRFGTASTSQDKLYLKNEQRRKGSLLSVRKTTAKSVDVRRTTYSEAKKKVGTMKKKSASQILPPIQPFDSEDPKSWSQWVDYATKMAEDWGHWIDKTIQDTADKAILYQTKAKEGKTQPKDVNDWNTFVEKTNEYALRWRRQRKSMFEAAKAWERHSEGKTWR